MKRRCTRQETTAAYVLLMPRCLHLIVEFQDGVHGDLRDRFLDRFRAVYTHQRGDEFMWPIDWPPLPSMSEARIARMGDLFLPFKVRDRRFALHVAIARGEKQVVERIHKMNSSLVTNDAYKCAVRFNQVDLMHWLYSCLHGNVDLCQFLNNCYDMFCLNEQTLQVLHNFDLLTYGLGGSRFWVNAVEDSALEFLFDRFRTQMSLEEWIQFCSAAQQCELKSLVDRILKELSQRNELLDGKIDWNQHVQWFHWFAISKNMNWIKLALQCSKGYGRRHVFEKAMLSNQIHVLELLKNEYNEKMLPEYWPKAVETCSVETLAWLMRNYTTPACTPWLKKKVCVSDVEMVKLLHRSGQPLNFITPRSHEVSQYLQALNIPNMTCDFQEINSHTSRRFDKEDLYDMVRAGDLVKIKYLREEKGRPWPPGAIRYAFRSNALEVVKYMVEIDKQRVINIIEGAQDLVEFTGRPSGGVKIPSIYRPEMKHSLEMVQYFVTGLPELADKWLLASVEFGDLETIQKMSKNLVVLSTGGVEEAICKAIKCGEIQILEHLRTMFETMHNADNIFYECFVEECGDHIEQMKKNYPFSGPWEQFTIPHLTPCVSPSSSPSRS